MRDTLRVPRASCKSHSVLAGTVESCDRQAPNEMPTPVSAPSGTIVNSVSKPLPLTGPMFSASRMNAILSLPCCRSPHHVS